MAISWRPAGPSEALRQADQECSARTKLWGKDAEAGAAANLVDLIEQVENVEAEFQPLVDPGVNRLDDAEIHLLVAGQGGPVRRPARERGSETAAGSEVEGKPVL